MQSESNYIMLFAIVSTIILLFLLSFIAAILFLYQKKNILYYKQLEDVKNKYEKSILLTQLEIQDQTFQDVSREIHDNIGLSLTLAKLQLNTFDKGNPANCSEQIESSIELIGKAIQDLSDISKSFNSEAIKNQGLYNMLKVATENINRSGKHHVQLIEDGDLAEIHAEKELILYRIAQEALNNILKHAGASEILIQLTYNAQHISLVIRDNGTGFDPDMLEKHRSGKIANGLVNMRTRAAMLSGTLTIKSSTDKGTAVSITAPY